MTNRTILVVDDEPGIVTVVRDYLDAAGFRVLTTGDGAQALRLARSEHPNLILLDLMLPSLDGFDVTRALRQDPGTHKIPIIMLTARVDEVDRLVGLELGGDDYITKPFSPREVVARVKAVLRRVEGYGPVRNVIQVGDLSIDLEKRTARRAGALLDLTSTEFDLLRALAAEPGRAFTRAQLVEQVYSDDYEGFDRTIDAHIKNLRRKIEPDPKSPQYILMVYGYGYKFADIEAGDE